MTASRQQDAPSRIAVVLPCYKVGRHILALLAKIPADVSRIYVVDDACPEGSGALVEAQCSDARVRVLRNPKNLGVGGAVMTGYRQAIEDGADVIVKIDGDGQMDPALIGSFVAPIVHGEADYTKGNRFFDLAQIHQMPALRIVGNAALSLLTKLSTGYWDLFDPTNGYTAIHARVASLLPFDKISARYFFESDMLFRLGTFRAVVVDVPMDARYGEEQSGLNVGHIIGEFAGKHLRNFTKRLFYNYFLRDFPLASLELVLGVVLFVFGAAFGAWHWWLSAASGIAASAGTVMIPTMSMLVGLQLLLAFLAYDIANLPRKPLQATMGGSPRASRGDISNMNIAPPE
jgi:glycosyltransferase involved in cell wall biosynthesis